MKLENRGEGGWKCLWEPLPGMTTRTPIHVFVPNTDQRGGGGGRSSAREIIGRVAAGALAKKILKLKSGIEILAFVSKVHQVVLPEDAVDYETVTMDQIESNIGRCPDPEYAQKMIDAIDKAPKVVCKDSNSCCDCLSENWQFALAELNSSHYMAICIEDDSTSSGSENGPVPLGLKVWKTIAFVEDTLVICIMLYA